MALPPGGIHDTPDGDKKRLMQRADSFAIGRGTREDREEIDAFDETIESVIKKAEKAQETKDQEQVPQELEKHREEHAQMEAERRGSSSPSHQPFLGLSVLPGIHGQLPIGQTQEAHSKQKSGAVQDKADPIVEAVSPEIVNGLKAAGLGEPLITLDDPRVSGPVDALKRWYVLSLQDNERVYVWNDNGCHQILTVGLRRTKLESAVGETVETVTRNGRIDQKQVTKRVAPPGVFNPSDHV